MRAEQVDTENVQLLPTYDKRGGGGEYAVFFTSAIGRHTGTS